MNAFFFAVIQKENMRDTGAGVMRQRDDQIQVQTLTGPNQEISPAGGAVRWTQ